MSRASRERERQARRAEYQQTRRQEEQDQRDERQYRRHHNGKDTAVHEAGHAVGAWIQGEKISHTMFNDRGSVHYNPSLDHLEAITSYGELTADEVGNAASVLRGTAEGFVQGCKSAFITLAGAVAQDTYLNGFSPITMREHGSQACNVLRFFCGIPEHELKLEYERLVPLVFKTFANERIRYVTMVLAKEFYERRFLSAESVMSIIHTAWDGTGEQSSQPFEEAKIVQAGK